MRVKGQSNVGRGCQTRPAAPVAKSCEEANQIVIGAWDGRRRAAGTHAAADNALIFSDLLTRAALLVRFIMRAEFTV